MTLKFGHKEWFAAKRGHEVTVYTCDYGLNPIDDPEIVEVKRLKPWFRYGRALFLPQLMKIKGYDIVHLHYPFYFGGELLYINSKLQKSKYIMTYHNDVFDTGLRGIFFRIHGVTSMKKVVNEAERICVVSLDYALHSFIKDIVERSRERVVEIPNGVDVDRFNPNVDPTEIRQRYNIENRNIILFISTFNSKNKGLQYLLQSLALMKNENIKLIIVGEGRFEDYYKKLSHDMGVADKAVFVGKVSNKDMPLYYIASDLVVIPSVVTEAFPLVLTEAMASGKPVIASDLPGIRANVEDGENGLLVEPYNVSQIASKIQYPLENEDVKKKFGKQARKKAKEKYSWEKITEKLEAVFDNVISS